MKKKNPFQQSEVSTHHSHTSIILMNQTDNTMRNKTQKGISHSIAMI